MSPAWRGMEARNLGDLGISQPQGDDGLRRAHATAASLQHTGYGMGVVYVRGWARAKAWISDRRALPSRRSGYTRPPHVETPMGGAPRWVPCLNPAKTRSCRASSTGRCERGRKERTISSSPHPAAAAAAARAASRRQRPQMTPPRGQKMTPACPSLNPVFELFASPLLVLGTPLWTWVLRLRLAARHENTILSGMCSPETPPLSSQLWVWIHHTLNITAGTCLLEACTRSTDM